MEDVLVSAVLGPVLETLKSLALREFAKAWGLKDDLDKLEKTLSTIQAVLRDAEQKQWKDEAVRVWLKQLKEAAEEAEDVIDEFYAQAAIRKVKRESGPLHRVGTHLCLPNRLLFRLKLGEKIIEVNGKLDKIAHDKERFHLTPNLEVNSPHNDTRETSSQVVESKTFGRDNEKEKLVDALLFQNGSTSLFVYAICGMGGIGKTTLAQLVYNDPKMDEEFKLKMWICVSENFGTVRLIRAMLESIEGDVCNVQSLDVLQRRLREKISGSKFMLVLDDVWNEDPAKWDKLKDVLITCGGKGSTVIVTTRNQKIATLMASVNNIHYLDRLSEDDSWSLFQQSVEADEIENYMETMGKTMLINCHGVPLAVKVLGGLMRTMKGEDEWRSIMESGTWDSQDDETSIFATLRLSYDHLSPHFRKCFTYCSVFPKAFVMRKDDLIQLWMANRFIPPREGMHWYDIGQEIFYELVSRYFIQDIEEHMVNGTICKVHDLMHDLASRTTSGECFSSVTQTKIPPEVRHLYYDMGNSTQQKKVVSSRLPTLRSLLLFFPEAPIFPEAPVVSNVSTLPSVATSHLRALYAPRCGREIQRTIKYTELILLRYLNLSYSDIEVLPGSIIYLQNLQTLNLSYCKSLRELPKNLRYLKNLSFLDIRGCSFLIMSDISQLKTQKLMVNGLSLFMGIRDQISDLREINPCGHLSLRNLQNLRNPEEAERANLKSTRNVPNLTLNWDLFMETKGSMSSETERIMEALQPHPDLKYLCIQDYPGSAIPNWFIDLRLKNLTTLGLISIEKWQHLPPLEKLPSLEYLMLEKVHSVKYIVSELYKEGEDVKLFPSLKSLYLKDMPNLVGWSTMNGLERLLFSRLKKVSLIECKHLPPLEKLPSLETLMLKKVNSVKYIVSELYKEGEDVKLFPSLRSLELEDMPSLVGWSTMDGMGTLFFPVLRDVKIVQCQHLPPLEKLPSLETLVLKKMHSVKYIVNELYNEDEDVKLFPSLKTLRLEDMPSLVGWSTMNGMRKLLFPQLDRAMFIECQLDWLNGLSPSMKELYFKSCDFKKFPEEGLENLKSLSLLYIESCPNLVSLPAIAIQDLSSLTGLCIYNCQKFASLPEDMKHLTSLQFLFIENCPELKTFPEEGLRHLNALNMLYVRYCEMLSSLPDCIGNWSSLKVMEISFCPRLVSLPISLRNSTSLQKLNIQGCPRLDRRCKKNRGEDWPKIAHIPYVWIDTRLITTSSDINSVSFDEYAFRISW